MELTYIYTSIYVYRHGIILYTYNNIQLIQRIAPENGQSDGSQSQSCNGSSAPATNSKNNRHHSIYICTMTLLQNIYSL